MILIQSCNLPPYPAIEQIQRETWSSKSEYPVYFYKPGKENRIQNDIITTKTGEFFESIFITTILAFAQALKLDWDHLIKTDNSCFINTQTLKLYLQNKPKEKFFAGMKVDLIRDRLPFIWGECLILSRDLVDEIVTNVARDPNPRYGAEDVFISEMLGYIKPEKFIIRSWYEEPQVSNEIFAYRCKGPLNTELEITTTMKELYNLFYTA